MKVHALVDENTQLNNKLLSTYCDLNQGMTKINQLNLSLKRIASKNLVIQKEYGFHTHILKVLKPMSVIIVIRHFHVMKI